MLSDKMSLTGLVFIYFTHLDFFAVRHLHPDDWSLVPLSCNKNRAEVITRWGTLRDYPDASEVVGPSWWTGHMVKYGSRA